MKTFNKTKLALSLTAIALSTSSFAAIKTDLGTASVDFRLRYEGVEQDNALKDADALTLRTKLNFKTIEKNGFSAFIEVENSLALIDDYNDTNGEGLGYSVVADPESTELDQAYVQYQASGFTAKIGRQVIVLDNHRYVGHVGWRQDKQTFDAASFAYSTDDLSFSYAYINKRNRIFADEKDINAKDHLFNASAKTSVGKVTGYGYLLENDDSGGTIDTYGVRLTGEQQGISYVAEYATQTAETATAEFDTSYLLVEAGTSVQGVKFKLGYESLGSDDGLKGFATPLATLHKFNGWADQFLATPNTGLNDLYFTVSSKLAGGVFAATYHDYSADEASALVDDLGNEINLVYTLKLGRFGTGVKYAMYSAGDRAAGKVDTDKLWLWVGTKF